MASVVFLAFWLLSEHCFIFSGTIFTRLIYSKF